MLCGVNFRHPGREPVFYRFPGGEEEIRHVWEDGDPRARGIHMDIRIHAVRGYHPVGDHLPLLGLGRRRPVGHI